MKAVIFAIAILLGSVSTFAFGGLCEDAAVMAVYVRHSERFLHADGSVSRTLQPATCEKARNQKVNICDVDGDNGEGAGDIYFRVVLNTTCDRVLRVELVGEE
jgi:hypothetical protein